MGLRADGRTDMTSTLCVYVTIFALSPYYACASIVQTTGRIWNRGEAKEENILERSSLLKQK
jgi:hypothetical protein